MSENKVLKEILDTIKGLSEKVETIESSLQFTQAVLTTMLTDIELVKSQYESIQGIDNTDSKVKEQIRNLKDFSKFIKPNVVKYGDGLMGFGLYNISEVSVQVVHLDKGKKFPKHMHNSLEVGVVYKGKIEVNYKSTKKIKSVADIMVFRPNEAHSGIAIERCELIFISIPSDSGYPGGVFNKQEG